MRVTITTMSGVEVARPKIEAAHQVGDLLALLPNQAAGIECSRRLFFGNTELMGFMCLSDIGVKEGSVLTLVFGEGAASLDCFLRRHRKSMVVCFWRVLARIARSR